MAESEQESERETIRHKEDALLLERIEMLESQVLFYSNANDKVSLGKKIKCLIGAIFCRENLELFLSITALVISISTAAYILYFR
jgi:hypothetical protein